jgi:hypothetical protein
MARIARRIASDETCLFADLSGWTMLISPAFPAEICAGMSDVRKSAY